MGWSLQGLRAEWGAREPSCGYPCWAQRSLLQALLSYNLPVPCLFRMCSSAQSRAWLLGLPCLLKAHAVLTKCCRCSRAVAQPSHVNMTLILLGSHANHFSP